MLAESKPSAAPTPARSVGTTDSRLFWSAVCAAAAGSRQTEAIVGDMRLVSLDADVVTVEVSEGLASRVQSRTPEIEQIFHRTAGRPMKLRVRTAAALEPTAETDASGAPAAPRTPPGEHPLVKKTLDLLGGKISGVGRRPAWLDDPEKLNL